FVDYDPARTTLTALHAAVKEAGYRVGAARARFGVRGIMCASCVTKIEQALRGTPGVLGASVNAGTEEAEVEYLPEATDLAQVKAAVGTCGYQVDETLPPESLDALDREAAARDAEYRALMRKWWFGAAVGVFTMIMSYPWLFPVLRDWFPRG